MSHIAKFFSIINDLDKIEVKIEDDDQTFLLLCIYLHIRALRKLSSMEENQLSSYNEVKKHLLNMDKIDNQLTGESYRDDFGQVHFSEEKSNNESFTGNPKHKNLVCNWCHKKGHIRSDCWIRKKKQQDTNVAELAKVDENKCDVLSVTDRSVSNKNRWIIDSRYLQHASSNRKMFFSYTSVQGERSSWGTLIRAR